MSTLAKRLKSARLNNELTQAQLAELVGVSQNSIQKIENGTTQETKHLLSIANALNVDPNWLQTGNGVMIADSKISNSKISNNVSDLFPRFRSHILKPHPSFLIKK